MLTQGEDVEAHALNERGWTISAIARHLGRDRKTIRAYLDGSRVPGQRARSAPDPLEPYRNYLTLRFADDPHVWASALHDEVRRLGYQSSYPTFTRQIRLAGLRPHCEACHGVMGRDTVEILHPPGDEIQWDWFERRRAPFPGTAYVLLGTLPPSGRIRGTLAESMVQAKHYGAVVEPCPPRRGNRKGSVESSVRFCSGRWFRTLAETDPISAERSLDQFLATIGDDRPRRDSTGARTTVRELAEAESLAALPAAPYPAIIEVTRIVQANATVNYRGNRYSLPPGLSGSEVTLRNRLGSHGLEIVAASGAKIAEHRLAHDGSGMVIRDPGHAAALEKTRHRGLGHRATTTSEPRAIRLVAGSLALGGLRLLGSAVGR